MSRKKVLLVDDEQDFLTLTSKAVNSWGYQTFIASCAAEALEILKREQIDALVLDYLMPDIDGIGLLKKIREKGYSAAAIMFTAKPSIKIIESAKGLNIVAFIPKISPSGDTLEHLKTTLGLV
jgi:two-component system OmpR family response regulator